jgi:hypothetical protein
MMPKLYNIVRLFCTMYIALEFNATPPVLKFITIMCMFGEGINKIIFKSQASRMSRHRVHVGCVMVL